MNEQEQNKDSVKAGGMRTKRTSLLNKSINRRNSREWALQMLFRIDITPPDGSLEEFFAEFWKLQADVLDELSETDKSALEEFNKPVNKQYRLFAEQLVKGVWDKRDEIDFKIEGYLQNWSIPRLGAVDRNVLRMAFFELFYQTLTPPVVIVNEAVDVAKYFSTKESGRFVNGILDKALRDVKRDLR